MIAPPTRASAFNATSVRPSTRATRSPLVVRAGGALAAEDVPTPEKRGLMNLLLAGAVGLPATSMLGPYAYFFAPPRVGGGSGGQVAKDALGNDVKASDWLKTHKAGARELVQGLKGDATYLVVTNENVIEKYGINAVCTHLGCVVPWNNAENKFMCPCHGSQYDFTGKKIRGPAPLSLALSHADIADDIVVLSQWTETDFRTGLEPWWK